MKNLLMNKVFLISVIIVLVLLNIFCNIYVNTHSTVECPIYILYTNNIDKELTKNVEKTFEEIQTYTDIPGERSYLLLNPESPRYNQLVSAYNLSSKATALIVVDDTGKVLSYKFPMPSAPEIKKIMKAIATK